MLLIMQSLLGWQWKIMNSNINLLAKKEDINLKEKKRIKILKIIAFSVLGVIALTVVILIILYSQLKLSTIKNDQESAIKNMSYLQEKSAKLVSINNRVSSISEINKNKKKYQDIIATLAKQIPNNIKVNGIDITTDEVSMRLASSSLYDIKILIDRMIVLAEAKNTIENLMIDSLSLNTKDNRYNLVFSAKLLWTKKR